MTLNAATGKQLWVKAIRSEIGDADPLIVKEMLILTAVKESCIIAVDLKNGSELWRVTVPDITYHYWLE